jgi:phospholipase/carboxylesterase
VSNSYETGLLQLEEWKFRMRFPEDRSSDRILLLLHGWSGDENSMWVFTRGIPGNYWIISPRAPFSAGVKGFSWRDIPPDGKWGIPQINDFHKPIELVLDFLKKWEHSNQIQVQQMDLMGFSQGAALVCSMLLLGKINSGKAACLAGFTPEGGTGIARKNQLLGTKIFVAHGISDEMISISRGKEMVDTFKFAGANVELCTEEVGHKVGSYCIKGLQKFFSS